MLRAQCYKSFTLMLRKLASLMSRLGPINPARLRQEDCNKTSLNNIVRTFLKMKIKNKSNKMKWKLGNSSSILSSTYIPSSKDDMPWNIREYVC